MDSCIFCKIVQKKLPCYKIYEDKLFFSFLDIYPRSIGHSLVIPKKHYRWVYDVKEFQQYWNVVKKITLGIQKSLSPFFITYVTHGLEIPHSHIHIIPRERDQTKFVPDIIKITKLEFKNIAETISSSV